MHNHTTPRDVLVWGRRGDARRPQLEATVARVFRDAHGATIHHFHDLLLGLNDDQGCLRGVIGATEAADCPALFLEAYLCSSVSRALESAIGRPVVRGDIVEVGNLAVLEPGVSGALMATLAHHLEGLGRAWAVFTVARELRVGLSRLGAELVDLGLANGERLGDELADWGRYYDARPRVVAVELHPFCRALATQQLPSSATWAWWEAARRAGEARRPRRASA